MKVKKLFTGFWVFMLSTNILLLSTFATVQAEETSTSSTQVIAESLTDMTATTTSEVLSTEDVEIESFEEHESVEAETPHPDLQALLDSLTNDDLLNAVGADGLGGSDHHSDEEANFIGPSLRSDTRASYENVNNYIKRNKFATPKIEKDRRHGTTPKLAYKQGRPIGVVVHETANNNSSIQGEVDYMFRNQENAFVHAFTDHNKIIETAPTNYLAWGAGKFANPFYIHIELVRVNTFDQFARSVNNDAYWIARQLQAYDLKPTLADNNNGSGTVISHNAVSRFLGGTNHVDPVTYFKPWGYDMDQFFALIEYHYYQKPSDKDEFYVDLDKDVTIKSGAVNNLHSRPYPYAGYKITGNTTSIQGKQVHLSQQAKTSAGTYYLADGIGWINAVAFTDSLDTVTKKTSKRYGTVRSDNYYYFYKEPYNTKGSYRVGPTTKNFYGKTVEITQQATNNRTKEVFYNVKDQGWVTASAFSKVYEEENITNLSKDVSIKPGAKNNVHSRPYPYYDFKITGTTVPHQGKQVHISQQAKTSNGTYYLVDGIGWIHSAALTTSLDTVTKTSNKQKGIIRSDSSYYFYKEPYNTKGAYRLGTNSKDLAGKDVNITQKAVNTKTKETFYYVDGKGWLGAGAFSKVYEEENISKLSKDASIKPGAKNNVHSRPYPYEGFQVTGTTVAHQGKQVHISQQAKTSNGLYYLVDGIGWIHSNAFTAGLETVSKLNVTQFATIKPNTQYYFYNEPYNTKGSYRTGKTTQNLSGQTLSITQTATNTRTKEVFYYVKDQGWLGAGAFSNIYENEVITKLSKDVTIKSSSKNNVHSRPYPYYGFKVIGTTVPHQGTQVHISEMAKTTNGTYYLADGIGWIRDNALTASLDTVVKTDFNKKAKILDKTYYFYDEPYNTLGSKRTGQTTNSFKNTDAILSRKAVSDTNGNIYYLIDGKGWVDQKAVSIY